LDASPVSAYVLSASIFYTRDNPVITYPDGKNKNA
jgi:hypothetical protein